MTQIDDILSQVHDRLITSELDRMHQIARVQRLERQVEAVLAYLDGLSGPYGDKHVIRELLGHHSATA